VDSIAAVMSGRASLVGVFAGLDEPPEVYAFGSMFWLTRNRFSGS
jgi:hypothetical protein